MSSKPRLPNHNDAVSALMSLAGNSEKPDSDTGTATNSPSDDDSTTPPPSKPNTSTLPANRFPEKLMAVLNSDSYSDIIAWSPDGKSFIFTDSNAFERVLLPNIFKVAKFDSFLRKLYRWGFSKCQAHSKVGCPAYKHEKFNRDQPDVMSDMECRSKPKTQYGNAAPMTLTSFHQGSPQFHQSAPQLHGHARNATFQNTASNAAWGQAQDFNPSVTVSMHSDTSMADDTNMADVAMEDSHNHAIGSMGSSMPALFQQSNILESARALSARALLNNDSAQTSVDQIMAEQMMLNRQAATTRHDLIGNHSMAGALLGQQQQTRAEAARPFSARSKTTPFNMKFMETEDSHQNHTYSINEQSTFSPPVSDAEQHARNPFLQQFNFGGMGLSSPQVPSQQGSINPFLAKVQALRLQEQQTMLRHPNIEALRLLRLSEERERLNEQFENRMILQNQIERIQIQNQIERRMQLQSEVDRLQQLNESQNHVHESGS